MTIYEFFDNTAGMNAQASAGQLKPNEAEDIVNMHLTSQGSWTTQNIGYKTLNTTALNSGATIHGMMAYTRSDGSEWVLVVAGNTLYNVNPDTGSASVISTTLDPTHRVAFTEFQNAMVITNGVDAPQTWSIDNGLQPLGGWPPTLAGIVVGQPAFSQVFANRLAMAGDPQNPSLLYISALENAQQYTPTSGATSAGSIQVSPGDGDRITGLKTLYLPLDNEEILVIFKQRSIYVLIGQDPTTFTLHNITNAYGAMSHHSIVVVGMDVVFLTEFGVASLNTATLQGNLTVGQLSQAIAPLLTRLNRYALTNSFALYMPTRQEIWWFVAQAGSSVNQQVLVLNLQNKTGAWSRRTGITASSGVVVNQQMMTGTPNGWLQRQCTSNAYDGAPIDWVYRTPFWAFGKQRLNKRIREVEVIFKQVSPSQVKLQGVWNDARTLQAKQTRQLSIAYDSSTALYQTAMYGMEQYSVPGLSRKRVVFDGSGQRFQLELSGSQTTQATDIEGWSITVMDGGFSP